MKNIFDKKNEFYKIEFKDLNLSGIRIDHKEFDTCKFIRCNFSASQFEHCKFLESEFIGCNLNLIKLKYSRFSDVVFDDCKATGINWTEVAWPNIQLHTPINFYRSQINYSVFMGLRMQEIVITECIAHEIDLREADLSSADLSLTDFMGSHFNQTILTAADLRGATNYHIDILNNRISKAKFSTPDVLGLLDSFDITIEPK